MATEDNSHEEYNQPAMLSLSPWDFDQSPSGWRSLLSVGDPQSNLTAVEVI